MAKPKIRENIEEDPVALLCVILISPLRRISSASR